MSSETTSKTGVLLINLGTPLAPKSGPVGTYLREFLSDPSVIDLPGPLRWLLVNCIIVPTRAPKSAEAYQKVWTSQGSPLLVHSYNLRDALAERLAQNPLDVGMRYGRPTIASALERLKLRGCDRVVCFSLYPHATESSTGTATRAVQEAAAQIDGLEVQVLPEYFDHPAWIEAVRDAAASGMSEAPSDHVLFSFHGLPERHIEKADPDGRCLKSADCCEPLCEINRNCYKAQCLSSAKAIADALGLEPDSWTSSFQSGLGRRWLLPSTEKTLVSLAESGVRKLTVLTPGFSADCLETIEELGMRGAELFKEAGGEELRVLPCLNANPVWVEALASMLEPHLAGET